jgi:hypothetical protein
MVCVKQRDAPLKFYRGKLARFVLPAFCLKGEDWWIARNVYYGAS